MSILRVNPAPFGELRGKWKGQDLLADRVGTSAGLKRIQARIIDVLVTPLLAYVRPSTPANWTGDRIIWNRYHGCRGFCPTFHCWLQTKSKETHLCFLFVSFCFYMSTGNLRLSVSCNIERVSYIKPFIFINIYSNQCGFRQPFKNKNKRGYTTFWYHLDIILKWRKNR